MTEATPSAQADTESLRVKARRDLGWDALLQNLSRHCAGDWAKERLQATLPFEQPARATRHAALVREALGLHHSGAALPVASVEPLHGDLDRLEKGAVVDGAALRLLASNLRAARSLRQHLNAHRGGTTMLRDELRTATELDALESELERALEPDGQVRDDATPALRQARDLIRDIRATLKQRLQRLLARHAGVLQGQYFAERDGRYVLPVRSDAEARPAGYVLDSSGSGSTLYIEPEELHGLGNDLRVAQASAERLAAAVLAELSRLASVHVAEVRAAAEACVRADVLGATATWAASTGCVVVRVVEEPVLVLHQARHPLLLGAGNAVVANDFSIRAGQVLVLSGPNAGGKTVNLKLAGLIAWMVRAGLPLPVDQSSTVGWFSDVVTDIGDDQSLSMSLSTFSAHMVNVARCLRSAKRGALVLLDELASGTDPAQGAPLALALLEEFRERDAAVVVTTHYTQLTSRAEPGDDSFVNASVGFDERTMQPTFTLTLGIPGTSAAFAVAERFGIESKVVQRAKQLMPTELRERQELTAHLESERAQLRAAREDAENRSAEFSRKTEALERAIEKAKQQQRAELERDVATLKTEVRNARENLRQAARVVSTAARSATNKDVLKQAEDLVNSAAHEVSIGGKLGQFVATAETPLPVPTPEELTAGLKVRIPHLNAEGVVVCVLPRGQVQVNAGAMRLTLRAEQLALPTQHKPPTPAVKALPKQSLSVASAPPLRSSHNTLELIGVRVEPALERLDAFIDQLLHQSEPAGFVVHGHGTGALRSAVREHLRLSSYVIRAEAAPPDDGGDALTVFWVR